jgi:multidrug efflux pump subunit AcrB
MSASKSREVNDRGQTIWTRARLYVPTITVSTCLPGASPDTMAASVAAPLERQFASIAGTTNIMSSSVEVGTSIKLKFNLERKIDAAALANPRSRSRRDAFAGP